MIILRKADYIMECVFEEELKNIIASCGDDVDITRIDEQTDLVRDFNFDSINIIQLIVQIESKFNIEIDDENLLVEKISSYKNLIDIIMEKLDVEHITDDISDLTC